METHRHQGHDLVLITQHPNLLDGNVRRLVGRHLHVRRVWGWNRAIVYEWDQATNPDRIGAATKRSWAYPKSAFGIYKSASVHTNRGQRPPWLLYMILVLPLILGYLGYTAYSKVTERAKPKETKMLETVQTEHPGVTFTTKYDSEQFNPVEKDVPLSAPAYNEIRHVSSMPQIAGCIASKAKCICYSQQGTRLEMTEETCRKNVTNPQFDPYRMANITNSFEKNTQGQTPEHELTQTEHKSTQNIPGAFEPGNMPVKKQVSGVWVDET
jgi:zona occludens toxin